MYNQNMQIYKEILEFVRQDPAANDLITLGVSGSKWSVIQSGSRYGIAMTVPSWKANRCMENPHNRSLSEVSEWILSWDFQKASLGAAAINCILNRSDSIKNHFAHVKTKGKLLPNLNPNELLVSVGDFPFLKQLNHPNLVILEKDPNKGTHPDSACEEFLPQANIVIITGASLINKSLHQILKLSQAAHTRILIGPSTPAVPSLLSPKRLTQLGVTVLTQNPEIPILAGLGASREIFDSQFSQALDIFATP